MSDKIAIKVEHASKTFKLPHDKTNSIKGALISRLRGGRQSYEIQKALDDVSFDINEGDFYGIVGRNGSGKSTLLKMLAGIYTPSSGSIQVNGKLTPFIELGVGFSPELSGRENVFLNGSLLGFSRSDMLDMYDDIVKFAELGKFMDQKLKNYSSGMQVRLAFSIAIRAQTDILLLDEVLAVGDAAFQQKCFDYFEELRARKTTVVFVSHDMGAVTKFCNKAVYIKDGVKIHEGTPSEVADIYAEDNLESIKENDAQKAEVKGVKDYKISTRIVEQTPDELTLEATFKSSSTDEMYVAMSLIRDSVSIGELTTPPELKLVGNGKVTLTIPLSLLNGGIYEVPVILCRRENRQLLCISKSKNNFVVRGTDLMRGASLKLPDTWKLV